MRHVVVSVILLSFVSFCALAKDIETEINGQKISYYIPEKLQSSVTNPEVIPPLKPRVLVNDPTPLPSNYKPLLNKMQQKNFFLQKQVVNKFVINYVSEGNQNLFGNTCQNFPDEAKAVFEKATLMWSDYIETTVPITIEACWTAMPGSTLGYSGSYSAQNFPKAPKANTKYTFALANSLVGYRLYAGYNDTIIAYNSNFSWYFGTDGNTPTDQHDLLSVVLHEIAHSLNFTGNVAYNGGLGYHNSGMPNIYDTMVDDAYGVHLFGSYIQNSTALGSALLSNNLWFNGANAKAANGGNKVKIFAPSTWMAGSSYAHLDYDTYNNTPNQLMVYAISQGEAIHDPGNITLGILKDVGWTINSESSNDDYAYAYRTTPYLASNNAYETFIKVYNRNTCAIDVKGVVYGDNGIHNDTSSLVDILSNIESGKNETAWASTILKDVQESGIALSESFGLKAYFKCSDGSAINADEIYMTVVQKSPQGQRVMPVYSTQSKSAGVKIIPYVSAHPAYLSFIKVLNTSNQTIVATLKGIPDDTGIAHNLTVSFPPNQVTLLWADTLASQMGIAKNSSFAVEIAASSGLDNLWVATIQKTSNGPRTIQIYESANL